MSKKEKAAREYKRHYKKAMKLKEGGKAWNREMEWCELYLNLWKKLDSQETELKYGRA